MFKLNLVLRRKSDDIVIFSPAPWFRVLFLILTAIIVVGVVTIASEDDEKISGIMVPVLIAALCFLAAFYEESWIFNKEKRIITSKFGLLFLYRKEIISLAEIKSIEVYAFLRGKESSGEKENVINIGNPFSAETTAEVSGKGRIIHRRWHQEIILNYKSGKKTTIERIDSKNTEQLQKKTGILADFCGIPLIKPD